MFTARRFGSLQDTSKPSVDFGLLHLTLTVFSLLSHDCLTVPLSRKQKQSEIWYLPTALALPPLANRLPSLRHFGRCYLGRLLSATSIGSLRGDWACWFV